MTVIDGRVRAFCSAACRERGMAPPAPSRAMPTDAEAESGPSPAPSRSSLPTEQRVLIAAAAVTMIAFVVLLVSGRHAVVVAPAAASQPEKIGTEEKGASGGDATESDAWLQPLAGVTRRVTAHAGRLFYGRDGIPASECTGGRCGIDIEAAAGSVVMAVHDGVVEAVEREPDEAAPEGRSIRIVHKGGEFTTSYLQLDGIREDLRPGVPVKLGEPIGTVARAAAGARPHLRFAISVRNGEGALLFLDPQPLLALWPIRRHATTSLRAMERAAGPRRTDSTE